MNVGPAVSAKGNGFLALWKSDPYDAATLRKPV